MSDATKKSAAPKSVAPAATDSFLSTFTGRSEFVIQAVIIIGLAILGTSYLPAAQVPLLTHPNTASALILTPNLSFPLPFSEAFCVRLFAPLTYGALIHEFDPQFNFRSTKYLVENGFYAFHNWFDKMSWVPIGRFVGGTVYPGLMWTAALFFHFLHNVLHFTAHIRNVCVFLSPFMASLTVIATYLLTSQIWSGGAGIIAAAFMSVAPGYISRSVAGSFDNEAVAIFAIVFCFYLWVKAVNTGSMFWGAAAALGYFNMVAAWGGYIFIINIIPMHALALMLAGRFSCRLYVAYCSFYVLGTLMSMQVQFVGFQPVSSSPEHIGAMGVFGLMQVFMFVQWIRTLLTQKQMQLLFRSTVLLIIGAVSLLVVAAALGKVPFFTARLLSLLGATSNIAIVKSVSEHQPSPWTTFFFDLHCVVFFVPVGMYFCFKHLTDANLFALIYAVFASYFASIMVRLVLVLTPIACVLAGVGVNVLLTTYSDVITASLLRKPVPADEADADAEAGFGKGKGPGKAPASVASGVPRANALVATVVLSFVAVLFYFFVIHSTWVTQTAYSSPSIVLMANSGNGERIYFDDFREGYTWLRHNTPENARIMSWWDYGYQITEMANRTVIVDNNTRNNTHIATVGLAMASHEDRAYEIMRALDVDYVLVVFGGRVGYSSDDINKFLWMVRISGGVFPEVVEADFYNSQGAYRIDSSASDRMRNSLMYRMCFHKFAEGYGNNGWDRVRHAEVGDKNIKLDYIEEAFTSEHWMVRIYRVKNEKTHPGFREKLELQKILAA